MVDAQKKYSNYKRIIDERILSVADKDVPVSLYEPIRYILEGGGKRIRPVLLIFACEVTGGNPGKAIDAAIAVEILHNFTLIHDDIMDNAVSRRGKITIHKKWDVNTAILAGDNLVGIAYSSLLNTKSERLSEIVKEFTNGIIEVCEGQAYDKEFESRSNVTTDDYILMIDKKTSKLLEMCSCIGALIGNATDKKYLALKNYAHNLGIAFQIQDDLLDISGDEKKFGKKIGGDIKEGKKTFMLLKALELVEDKRDRNKLQIIIGKKGLETIDKNFINEIKRIYYKYGVVDSAQEEIKKYIERAEKYIKVFDNGASEKMLRWFSQMLLGRSY